MDCLIFLAFIFLGCSGVNNMNPGDFQYVQIPHGVQYTFGDGTITDGRYYSRDYGDTWADYGVNLYHIATIDNTTALGWTNNIPNANSVYPYVITSDGKTKIYVPWAGFSAIQQPSGAGFNVAGSMDFFYPSLRYDKGNVGGVILINPYSHINERIVEEACCIFKIIGIYGNEVWFIRSEETYNSKSVFYRYDFSSKKMVSVTTLTDNSRVLFSCMIQFSGVNYLIVITALSIWYSTDAITFKRSKISGISQAAYLHNKIFNSIFITRFSNESYSMYRLSFENGKTIQSYDNADPDMILINKFEVIQMPMDTGTEQAFYMWRDNASVVHTVYSLEGSTSLDQEYVGSVYPIKAINADGTMITNTDPPYKVSNVTIADSGIYIYTANGIKQLRRFNISDARCFDGQRFLHAYTTENASREIILYANTIPPLDCSHGCYNIYGTVMYLY